MEKGEKYHIQECYLVWKPANRLPFRGQEKVEIMDVLTSVVLSHLHIVSMLLSVLKVNLAPFLREEALNGNVMRNYMSINLRDTQSSKREILHKIRGKSLKSLRSPSPSPIILPCCFIRDILPNPLPP